MLLQTGLALLAAAGVAHAGYGVTAVARLPKSTPVDANSIFASNDNRTAATAHFGQLELFFMSVPVAKFGTKDTANAASWFVTSSGVIKVQRASVSDYLGTAISSANCYGLIQDDGAFKSVCDGANTPAWDSGMTQNKFAYWAIYPVLNFPYDPNNLAAFSKSWGSGTYTFMMDSGIDDWNDVSNGFSDTNSRQWLNTKNFEDNSGDNTDYIRHGTRIASILKNKWTGLAQSTTLFNVKITTGAANTFSVRSFVSAMRYIANYGLSNKIVNWSGYFPYIAFPAICATQWAYFNGVTIISAAGNDNTYINNWVPYMLNVGAAYNDPFITPAFSNIAPVSSRSNYGPGVDIWGPVTYIATDTAGTSLATAFVTGIAAQLIQRFPSQLSNRPGSVYKHIYNYARKDFVQAGDKTNQSRAGQRFVSMNTGASSNTPATDAMFTPSSGYDWCGATGWGLPMQSPSSAHWDTLVNNSPASNSDGSSGKLVTTAVYSGK